MHAVWSEWVRCSPWPTKLFAAQGLDEHYALPYEEREAQRNAAVNTAHVEALDLLRPPLITWALRPAGQAREEDHHDYRRYSPPKETFAEGDWIDHPKFGRGRVKEAKKRQVVVAFLDTEVGTRKLAHGLG